MSVLPPTPPGDSLDGFEFRNPADAQAPEDVSGQKLKRLAVALLSRWYWIALCGIIGYLASQYYLTKAPKLYTATTTLLVSPQSAGTVAALPGDKVNPATEAGMNTIAERIRRMDLFDLLARRQDVRDLEGLTPEPVDWTPEWARQKLAAVGLANPVNPASPETKTKPSVPEASQLAGMIAGWTRVSIRRSTQLIDISVTHPVPEVATRISDAISREYLAEVAKDRSEGRQEIIKILEAGCAKTQADMQSASGSLATYERTLEVHKALDAKENDVIELQRRYLPKHPRMISTNAEMESLRQRFLAEFDTAREAESDKAYWENAGELPDRASDPEEFLQVARQRLLSRVSLLTSEFESSSALFNSFKSRLEAADLDPGNRLSIVISSFARLPGGHSSPNEKKITTSGSMAGLASGLLLALLFVRLDNKFHTVAQVAAETGAPILASISDIKTRHLGLAERAHFQRLRKAVEPTDGEDPGPAGGDWDELMLFRPGTSATSYAEMFRVLRASVSLLGDETRRKITLFTSAIPGEGKSFIAANFALAAAAQGKKTLLIDLDLRKPTLHRIFGVARAPERGGVTDCLANQATLEKVVAPVEGQPGLHLAVSGKRAPNPGELLESGKLRRILAIACHHYDVVVIDSAPLLSVPDSRLIAPLAHNVCLVVRAEYTPKVVVSRALKLLGEDRTQLGGVVVNGYKERRRLAGENNSYGYYDRGRSGSLGSYGYGSYGSYGSDEDEEEPRNKRRKRKPAVQRAAR